MQSWERDPHAWRFIARRLLRIWPALAVVTLFAVLCIGPIFTTLTFHDYFRAKETWGYFSHLYLRTTPNLPGLFEGNPIHVVNGSLWTIPIEAQWYGLLLAAGMCGLLRPRFRYFLLAMVALYAAYIYLIFDVQHNPLSAFPFRKFGCEYGTFFCYGAVLHCMRHAWVNRVMLTFGSLLLLACLLAVSNHQYAAVYVLLPFIVIWLGNKSTPVLKRAGRFGDFSYGIYVYAFLMQQLVVSVMGIYRPYLLVLLISSAGTMICAVLSWHLVERPSLALKRYLPKQSLVDERLTRVTTPSATG
ncbi:hypothetical protein GCM10007862_18290 [Dyella lipolytica]|nr:hypothetical protein GCM10007862_18290 [Dyella lipolytica]